MNFGTSNFTLRNYFKLHLRRFNEQYKISPPPLTLTEFFVVVTLDGKNLQINVTSEWKENIHVIVGGRSVTTCDDFRCSIKQHAPACKEKYSTVPMIFVGYTAEKNFFSDEIKKAELKGETLINRTTGEKIAREFGAIKYIECSRTSGRGVRTLIDEIAVAGFGKLQEVNEEQDKMICCEIL